MVVTLGQQYNVGEKPTAILYTSINHHAEPLNKTRHKTLYCSSTHLRVVMMYDNRAIEPYKNSGLGQIW